ncbi:integrin alpha-9-like [Salvelinus sp. IW2-2015]|uniref:integrin alpha-9-like n=1 Tax=Salvelinus sp. IW2-2015 TaxID=2691554 RepID=UPI0038D4A213
MILSPYTKRNHDTQAVGQQVGSVYPLVHEVDTAITGLVTPTSFLYGNSIDASRFIQLEDKECNFQPLNFTFQVINNGPSRLPGSIVDIRIPNRLAGNGADMFHIMDTQVAEGRGNCTPHRNPKPCSIPQDRESIFHTIFAFFTKSGRRVLDCDRPGRACLTISCTLGSQSKEEVVSIDVKLLLNTEILKRDSSSLIQFVTRGNVRVDGRAIEVPQGLSEDTSLVFEALHSQEPRGYVVGWIIAMSLLVGILIFLLLAVLLWKVAHTPHTHTHKTANSVDYTMSFPCYWEKTEPPSQIKILSVRALEQPSIPYPPLCEGP